MSVKNHDGGAPEGPTAEEQAAFTRLFETCFEPVLRYVRGYVPMQDEAEDIAHLVFYRVWTKDVELDPTRPPLPFLCTLARFAAIDYLRHERVEDDFARRYLQAAELEGPPVADDPELEFLRQERADVVMRAIDALSPRQRQVVMMRWSERQSRAEIAQRLNVSLKTVAMHLARAKENLREMLPGMYDLE